MPEEILNDHNGRSEPSDWNSMNLVESWSNENKVELGKDEYSLNPFEDIIPSFLPISLNIPKWTNIYNMEISAGSRSGWSWIGSSWLLDVKSIFSTIQVSVRSELN
jgi:hypothetical protein